MTFILSKNPLAKKIIEGDPNPDMLNLLIQKQLPFTELDYLETFVFVIKKHEYKDKAIENLKNISDSTKTSYIQNRNLNINVAYYVLIESLAQVKNEILEKIIQNNQLPYDFLKKIAEKGNEEILETLSENQIRLIAFPDIIDLMEGNPKINKFTLGKLDEIRRFYLTDEKAEEIKAENLTDDIFEFAAAENELDVEEVEQKDEEIETEENVENASETEEDVSNLISEEIEHQVLTRLQEINNMSVAERIKTALLGTKSDRSMLIKDPNKLVCSAVIESPKLSMDEVGAIVKSKSTAIDIISKISKRREWTKSYPIMMELVMNPKTPVSSAIGFLKKLHVNDLKLIRRDRNVSPVIRNFASKLQEQKG